MFCLFPNELSLFFICELNLYSWFFSLIEYYNTRFLVLRTLWIVITVCTDYSHILICPLISLWYGTVPCSAVLLEEHFNLVCVLNWWLKNGNSPDAADCLYAERASKHCAVVGYWGGACKKITLTLVRLGCLYDRFWMSCGGCPGSPLWWRMRWLEMAGKEGRGLKRDIPPHEFIYILSCFRLDRFLPSNKAYRYTTPAQNSQFLCAQETMLYVSGD